ncbi:urea ABC transporter permease subunit UrtB [Acidimangrovimonas sediminis]|uniref:urea ABC transporter permease subunit UrtB n=1 Tax=Acidimangrovimonas sediminis TaxID=2056283 RepID=UPI000C80A1BE|nr:urea ABC transporter permease subunit UrtB [Acidimangrovimonas sediminis]
MLRLFLAVLAALLLATGGLRAEPVGQILDTNRALIQKSSRLTIGPVIDALATSGDDRAEAVLQAWGDKHLGIRKSDGAFVLITRKGGDYVLTAPDGKAAGTAKRSDIDALRPNAGVRRLIDGALVQFQLNAPKRATRAAALDIIDRHPEAGQLKPLEASIPGEFDPGLRSRKERMLRLLTIRFGDDGAARIKAIESFGADTGLDLRGALNPLLDTKRVVTRAGETPPGNVARQLIPGKGIGDAAAYDLLVKAGDAPARLTPVARKQALEANIEGGKVGGVPVPDLSDPEARDRAYSALEQAGKVPQAATAAEVAAAVAAHAYWDVYAEPSKEVTDAARAALSKIALKVDGMEAFDLLLEALSLASIYFLAAIGLALTFGVMGVINMAHGEFIMMGAYTGYVVQQWIPNYTVSLLVALPLAFAVTFAAGVAMERLVVRHLYKRPLETLLATFGVSIALQQIAKNIFGTQARPLTSPAWLDGAWVLNDVVSISYIRIAIFVLGLVFLLLFLFVMNRTRLGLELRAVTQNPAMAASMGINPDRINMLAFGLGSGIAGIAGIALGLFAKVTSELGQDYIVQSFMTVVVGGVGNIFGTLAGAALIGTLQKGIEWLNPSNTLAAQTYMILFIILFIQVRPRGIIALKGRAAGD